MTSAAAMQGLINGRQPSSSQAKNTLAAHQTTTAAQSISAVQTSQIQRNRADLKEHSMVQAADEDNRQSLRVQHKTLEKKQTHQDKMNRYLQQKKEELATSATTAKKGFLLANIKLSGSSKVNTRRGNYQMMGDSMSMMLQTEQPEEIEFNPRLVTEIGLKEEHMSTQ